MLTYIINSIPDAVRAGDAKLVESILLERSQVVKSGLKRPIYTAVLNNDIETAKVCTVIILLEYTVQNVDIMQICKITK